MTKSLWTLTLDPSGTPLVILAAGDALDDEIRFGVRNGLEVVQIEAGTAPVLRPRGNASWEIEFERRIIAASDIAARAALLDWQITLANYAKKSLRVAYTGENDYWTFANACITRATTYRKVADKNPAYVLSVGITAAGLTKTVVA
jgi:hypothetical protein